MCSYNRSIAYEKAWTGRDGFGITGSLSCAGNLILEKWVFFCNFTKKQTITLMKGYRLHFFFTKRMKGA